MDTNFLLQLTGLCGLVPNDQGGMRFVLLNAKSMNPPHVAAILVREGELDTQASTRKPDRAAFQGNLAYFGSARMLAFYLQGEDVTISPKGTNIPWDRSHPPSSPCPDWSRDWQSLAWVAHMAEFGAGTMSSDHYSGQDSTKVLARIDIPRGIDLATAGFGKNENMQVGKITFKSNQNAKVLGISRPLANVVAMGMSVPPPASGTTAAVTLSSSAGKIVLNPISGRITAWIVNIPEAELVTDTPIPKVGEKNEHFGMLFGMAKSVGDAATPEMAAGDCGSFGGGSASSPKCPPALFDSHG
jgi:hypothetical protein